MPAKLAAVASGLWDWVGNTFRTALDEVISLWNDLHFSVPSVKVFGHRFGGETIGVPQIPMLANGGIVNSPTLAMIGEAGPEAVVPLSGGGAGGIGGDMTVNIPVVLDGQTIGMVVAPHVRKTMLQQRTNRYRTGLS
jgi:hypothetical protein